MNTITKKDAIKWCKALYSGEYKQTKGKLQDAIGYCCMGVACSVFVERYPLNNEGYILGCYPSIEFGAPEWLHNINSNFHSKSGSYLATFNDVLDYNFKEIADLIYMVYVLRVLD